MVTATLHGLLIGSIKQQVQLRHPIARIFTRQAGMVGGAGFTASQLKGLGDIWGVISDGKCHAIHFEIECKTKSGKLRPEQKFWQETCNSIHVPHRVVHVNDASEVLPAAIETAAWVGSLIQ